MEHHKKNKALESKAKNLLSEWMDTGIKRPHEKFFGLLSKKQMSIAIIAIIVLLAVTDIAIFYLLYLTQQPLVNA